MNEPEKKCSICERSKSPMFWECSHVNCPNRRPVTATCDEYRTTEPMLQEERTRHHEE